MIRLLLPLALCAVTLTACPPPDDGGGHDGGQDGGPDGTSLAFNIQTLDPTATDRAPHAVTLLPNDKVGVAYYVNSLLPDGGVATDDGGVTLYDLKYLEWSASGVTQPTTLDTVERFAGLGLAAQPNGQPAVAYLGGHDNSIQSYWFQNDAYLKYRTPGGTWSTDVVVQNSNEAPGTTPVSNAGFLVGLHPALAFDGNVSYFVYRDCHNGQFQQQDFNGADVEVASGWVGGWTKVVASSSDNTVQQKLGYGGHNHLIIVNHTVYLVMDRIISVADGPGTDVLIMKRDPGTGAWSLPKTILSTPDNQIGPSFAYDDQAGFGVAAIDRSQNLLEYISSADGTTWTVPDQVWQSGTGGWWPALGFDPASREPEIVYYYCDDRPGIQEGSCRESDDELRIASRLDGWSPQTVDPSGGYAPKLLYLSTGKRVIVYRDVKNTGTTAGNLKIAVEK